MSIVYDFRTIPDFKTSSKPSAAKVDAEAIRHEINLAIGRCGMLQSMETALHQDLDKILPGTGAQT